ncbi:hypothetical protein SeMB42_g00069 [Synchytrium endobioticum]|nr:hypothetical protein SeMB42_g00069 [Synchytrium endobioticum]
MFEFLHQVEQDSHHVPSSQPDIPYLSARSVGSATPIPTDLPSHATETTKGSSTVFTTGSNSAMPPSESTPTQSTMYILQTPTPRSPRIQQQPPMPPVQNIVTCTVGSKASNAKYYMSSVSDVLSLLDSIANTGKRGSSLRRSKSGGSGTAESGSDVESRWANGADAMTTGNQDRGGTADSGSWSSTAVEGSDRNISVGSLGFGVVGVNTICP